MRGLIVCAAMGLVLATGCSGEPAETVSPGGGESGGGQQSGGDSGRSALYELAESYPSLDSSEIKDHLDRLTVEDHFVLEFAGEQFKPAVFRAACDADSSLTWTYLSDGSVFDCSAAEYDYEQAVEMVGAESVDQNAELGRQDVLIYLDCQAGDIDQATCDTYYQVQSEVDQAAAQTSEQIIDNMGDQCEVGRDAGCYP